MFYNSFHQDLPFDEAAEAEPQDCCGDQVLVRHVFLILPLLPPPPAGRTGASWTGSDSYIPRPLGSPPEGRVPSGLAGVNVLSVA